LVDGEGSAAPSVESAARQVGVAVSDVDEEFGVVPIDPAHGRYAIQVWADRVPPGLADERPYRGPFADPEIAPFQPASGPKDEE